MLAVAMIIVAIAYSLAGYDHYDIPFLPYLAWSVGLTYLLLMLLAL